MLLYHLSLSISHFMPRPSLGRAPPICASLHSWDHRLLVEMGSYILFTLASLNP
jgi:hypothetical protein